MNYYLIDYENVGSEGIKALKDIKNKDMLIVFYSENSSQCLPLDILNEQTVCRSIKVGVGTKNALDFQLSSYLGYLIGSDFESDVINTEYIIVSNDGGYDCLCNYWKSFSIKVKRMPIAHNTLKSETVTLEELKSIVGKKDYSDELLNIINKHDALHDISNGIQKMYKDSTKSGEMYRKLKAFLTKKGKV